jgi:hypothetical protein
MKSIKYLGLSTITIFALAGFGGALAHTAHPCAGGDGESYAQHHIVPLAKAGMLGNGGHKPGSHGGFSLCNPSGK